MNKYKLIRTTCGWDLDYVARQTGVSVCLLKVLEEGYDVLIPKDYAALVDFYNTYVPKMLSKKAYKQLVSEGEPPRRRSLLPFPFPAQLVGEQIRSEWELICSYCGNAANRSTRPQLIGDMMRVVLGQWEQICKLGVLPYRFEAEGIRERIAKLLEKWER